MAAAQIADASLSRMMYASIAHVGGVERDRRHAELLAAVVGDDELRPVREMEAHALAGPIRGRARPAATRPASRSSSAYVKRRSEDKAGRPAQARGDARLESARRSSEERADLLGRRLPPLVPVLGAELAAQRELLLLHVLRVLRGPLDEAGDLLHVVRVEEHEDGDGPEESRLRY
jgi:hypothetical protein